jgi:tetratricopeptide (TPR) repeat protein
MKIIYLFIFFILFLNTPSVFGQKPCADYACVIGRVKKAMTDKKYRLAFEQLESAYSYPNKNIGEVSKFRKQLFDAIEKEMKVAIEAQIEVIRQKVRLETTLKDLQEANDRTELESERVKATLKDLQEANDNLKKTKERINYYEAIVEKKDLLDRKLLQLAQEAKPKANDLKDFSNDLKGFSNGGVFVVEGMVRELNSGRKPIADVQIIFASAAPTTSDQAGRFRLDFINKKVGDAAFMTEINKKGYELVNRKELEHIRLGTQGIEIILAKAGVLEAARIEYYNISEKEIKIGFEKEKNRLKEMLLSDKLSKQQYQDQYEAFQMQYDNQKREMENLSSTFAKVNFDDVSELYKKALILYKSGKIDEAIKILENTELNNKTNSVLNDSKDINIKSLKLQAEIYLLKFDIKKAEIIYEQILLLDSTNLDKLREISDFYRTNNKYEKALLLYPKIISHPKIEVWQKALAYIHNGDMYITIGNLDNALTLYETGRNLYSQLVKENPKEAFYKNGLAILYSKLGEINALFGNLDKTLSFYEEYNRLEKELCADYPNNVDFKNNLAISYYKLGEVNTSLGNLDKALRFYEEYNRLEKELCTDYPNNVDFKNNLAISYYKLGEVNTSLGNLDKALSFYEEYNLLMKELCAAYPNNVDFKDNLAISYSKLAEPNTSSGNLGKALSFYEEYNRLVKELYSAYPNNVNFKMSLAISYSKLGEVNTSLGNLDKALSFYKDMNKLFLELNNDYSTNVNFKAYLAISYSKLGAINREFDKLDESLTFYEESLKLEKELYNANPNNVSSSYNLANTYFEIGLVYEKKNDKAKALDFFKQSESILLNLVKSSPDYQEFKKKLKLVQAKLSEK